MAKSKFRVCLVDDDPAVRDAFRLAAKAAGIDAITFGSAQEFLGGFNPAKVGCIILDAQMPGMSGLELQDVLRARKTPIPILILTENANVALAVQAIKNGALDVIQKPVKMEDLAAKVKLAFGVFASWQKVEEERQEINERIARLTPRELDVFGLMADGLKNKAIAKQLGITMKTLDFHRTKVVAKMKSRTWADLVRWRLLAESDVGGVATIKAGGYLH